MIMKYYISSLILFVATTFVSCDLLVSEDLLTETQKAIAVNPSEDKGLDSDYWYSGEAEVSKYALDQYRYRDVHNGGELVTIFVTEDFLTDKQVKNDNYTNKNSTPILKLNSLRRFTTGIYDYSMMTSVFTRVDGSSTDKVTLSSQDWCGQSFVQLNKTGKNKYKIQIRSYFENEGDKDFTVTADLLEDELFTLLRIDPDMIPTGKVSILPSLTNLRFSHDNMRSVSANIAKDNNSDGTASLVLSYEGSREVKVTYDTASPHKIRSISDTSLSRGKTSVATLSKQIKKAYWGANSLSDLPLRKELSLSGFGD